MVTPTLILDCSMVLAWFFEDEFTPEASVIQQRLVSEAAVVPAIWLLEVHNAILTAERRGRTTPEVATKFLTLLKQFDIRVEQTMSWVFLDRVMTLARAWKLTTYDATYLDLALRTGLPLCSLDVDLRQAYVSLGGTVLGMASSN